MKNLLLLLTILSAVSINAQITFNGSYIANLGDTVFLAEDTSHSHLIDLGEAAGDQVWDFTMLTEDKPDGAILEPVSTAPLNSLYPTADFVANDLYEDSIHLFFKRTSTYLDIVGVVEYDSNGSPTPGALDGNWRFIQYPIEMGDTFSSEFITNVYTEEIAVDFDGAGPHPFIDSIRTTITAYFFNEIDAWGEVQLPQGNYMTLRQSTRTVLDFYSDCYYDSLWQPFTPLMMTFLDPDSTDTSSDGSFRWWTDDSIVNLFVAQVDVDSNGMPDSSISYTKEIPTPPLGIESGAANAEIVIYPNPSSDIIRIDALKEEELYYTLYDIDAKVARRGDIRNSSNMIDVSNLSNGVYLLQLTRSGGQTVKLEKVQVVH